MLVDVNGLLLLDGVIEKIKFNEQKGNYLVSFKNQQHIFEFRNGKKARADMVKKMKLKPGEWVIVTGMKNQSTLYVYGWDIKREGYISTDRYCLIHGTVSNITEFPVCRILTVNNLGKLATVMTNKKTDVAKDDMISVLCYIGEQDSCPHPCQEWKAGGCTRCRKLEKEKRYHALRIERRQIPYGNFNIKKQTDR